MPCDSHYLNRAGRHHPAPCLLLLIRTWPKLCCLMRSLRRTRGLTFLRVRRRATGSWRSAVGTRMQANGEWLVPCRMALGSMQAPNPFLHSARTQLHQSFVQAGGAVHQL